MKTYDIIIVGAGIAGLSLARELSGTGYRVLILDMKRNVGDVHYRTLGSFIDPVKWGLPHKILNPIHTIYLSSKNEHIERHITNVNMNIIDRPRLLEFLEREATGKGTITIHYDALLKDTQTDGQSISSITYTKGKHKQSARAHIYADCSGIGLALSHHLRLAPRRVTHGVGMEYIVPLRRFTHAADLFLGSHLNGGYGWIFPLNKRKAIVGVGTLIPTEFRHVKRMLDDMWKLPRVKDRCEPKPLSQEAAILRTGPPLKRLVSGNLIILGDSALQANPVVGEGTRFIMEAARMAARSIQISLQQNDKTKLRLYEQWWKKKYAKPYRLGHQLQTIVAKKSSSDRIMDMGVRYLGSQSTKDFIALLSGDLSYLLLTKTMAVRGLSLLR